MPLFVPPHFQDIPVIISSLALFTVFCWIFLSPDEIDTKTTEESVQEAGKEDKAHSDLKV